MKKLIPILIIIVLLVIIRNIISSIHLLVKNENVVDDLQVSLDEQKRQHIFLRQRLFFVKTDEFVEQEAREKLGLVKEGEYVVLAPPPKKAKEIVFEEDKENYEKWWDIFF